MTHNCFAVVVKESKHAALLMGLRNQTISDDGFGQIGTEAPILDPHLSEYLLNSENVWRAKRSEDNGRISYWDGRQIYTEWNGQPMSFNYMD